MDSLRSGRVRASSIEMRLLEMQRKLSAIAEIPKILSSTLATVSQSFGRISESDLEDVGEEGEELGAGCVQRKFSYDEDALDYELRDGDQAGDTDSDEDDLVQVPEEDEEEDREDEAKGGKQSKLVKDVTPESDYASEANYPANEPSHDTETEDEDEDAGHAVYFIKLPRAVPSATEEYASPCPSDQETDDDDDDSDFLSTTYTWNLRNVPKLRINDAEAEPAKDELQESGDKEEKPEHKKVEQIPEDSEQLKVRPATPTPQNPPQDSAEGQTQKLLFRLDRMERSWPWADRKKIIYKQSTCHLVPRKPLGLVGQRMQLLLKDRKE